MTRASAAAMQTYAAVFEPRGRVIACTCDEYGGETEAEDANGVV